MPDMDRRGFLKLAGAGAVAGAAVARGLIKAEPRTPTEVAPDPFGLADFAGHDSRGAWRINGNGQKVYDPGTMGHAVMSTWDGKHKAMYNVAIYG